MTMLSLPVGTEVEVVNLKDVKPAVPAYYERDKVKGIIKKVNTRRYTVEFPSITHKFSHIDSSKKLVEKEKLVPARIYTIPPECVKATGKIMPIPTQIQVVVLPKPHSRSSQSPFDADSQSPFDVDEIDTDTDTTANGPDVEAALQAALYLLQMAPPDTIERLRGIGEQIAQVFSPQNPLAEIDSSDLPQLSLVPPIDRTDNIDVDDFDPLAFLEDYPN